MSKIKKMMPILLVLIYLLTAFFMVKGRGETAGEYNRLLRDARQFAENGIVSDAIDCYEDALAINPTAEIYLEAGAVYLDNEEYQSAKKWYNNKLLTEYPNDARVYEYGMTLFLRQEQYSDAFDCYETYQNRGLQSEAVEALIDEIYYAYRLSGQYDAVSLFSNTTNTAAVQKNGLWGYISASGDRKISYQYTEAGVFSDTAVVTDTDGETYYIDSDGNRKISMAQIERANPESGAITQLKRVESNLILAGNGSVWSYYDADTLQEQFGDFRDATVITNGVGAVSDASGKWALISSTGELLTEYQFDQVLADQKETVCRNAAIIVQLNGHFVLVDREGNLLSEQQYDEACAFNDATYAAMKRDGKWYFVDDQGTEYSLGEFEEAKSFSAGLAAVRQDGLWGYITMDGTMAIECQFEEAEAFNRSGSAFVKAGGSKWTLLELYRYQN